MEEKAENKVPGWIQIFLWVGGIAVIGYLLTKLINLLQKREPGGFLSAIHGVTIIPIKL
jgi:hypothetical protein